MAFEQQPTPKRRLGERILALVKRIVPSRGENSRERCLNLTWHNCNNNQIIVAQSDATDEGHIERVADIGGNADVGNGQNSVPQLQKRGLK